MGFDGVDGGAGGLRELVHDNGMQMQNTRRVKKCIVKKKKKRRARFYVLRTTEVVGPALRVLVPGGLLEAAGAVCVTTLVRVTATLPGSPFPVSLPSSVSSTASPSNAGAYFKTFLCVRATASAITMASIIANISQDLHCRRSITAHRHLHGCLASLSLGS